MVEKVTESRDKQTRLLDHDIATLVPATTRRAKGLARLGVSTLRDLINFYPFRYNDFSQVISINQSILGQQATIYGVIREVKVKRPRKRLLIIEASVVDDSGIVVVTWFNQSWLQKTIAQGARIILKGVVEHNYGFYRMNSPLYTILSEEDKAGGIMPVYHANSDITQGWVVHMVSAAFATLPALLDPLPAKLRIRQGFMSRHAALRAIHNPKDEAIRREARRRLAFEEIFLLQLSLLKTRRENSRKVIATKHKIDGSILAALQASLPFTLTADQSQALSEILADMASSDVMNRLLLGDVGSGKTIVAALALAAVCDSKHQAVMMAPTEVLAEQYAQKVGPLFDSVGISWALLTSSTKPKERNSLVESVALGNISVVFGTHALLESDMVFADLSLAIIDEQHRFGVMQRRALLEKGQGVDFLSMTATPIPRSLALTIYGDMDTSSIRTKPRENTVTTTKIINRADIRFAYEAIAQAVKRGEQAYIVCPLITAAGTPQKPSETRSVEADTDDEDTTADSIELITEFSLDQDDDHIKAAEQEVSYLRDIVFPTYKIELMTSKLKSADKRRVMDDFRGGRTDVLVSTTVVEVGVDVPNATVMVIQDADRFGLSQLHQLRGRVGRGERDGSVFLVTGTRNEDSKKRLQAMEKSSDGFKLAEYDLALRREGDILGSRQSGASTLKLVNVIHDADLIQESHTLVRSLLNSDPELAMPEHRHLRYEIERLFDSMNDGEGHAGNAGDSTEKVRL